MTMNIEGIQEEAGKYQQQSQAAGLRGTMYLLSCPSEGWLKLQLKGIPAPLMTQLIDGFEKTLAMGGTALNLVVKTKCREAKSDRGIIQP
jgi:hypothetical protein